MTVISFALSDANDPKPLWLIEANISPAGMLTGGTGLLPEGGD